MTILQDECKPTKPAPSDAVVELIAGAIRKRMSEVSCEEMAEDVLSALSDAGLAVLPDQTPTEEMVRAIDSAIHHHWPNARQMAFALWQDGAAAFHPSQLETEK